MSVFWSMTAQLGFWGWLAATVGFILTVLPHRGSFNGSMALRWGIPFLVSYGIWVVGMLNT